jgi:hypothetical protein
MKRFIIIFICALHCWSMLAQGNKSLQVGANFGVGMLWRRGGYNAAKSMA